MLYQLLWCLATTPTATNPLASYKWKPCAARCFLHDMLHHRLVHFFAARLATTMFWEKRSHPLFLNSFAAS